MGTDASDRVDWTCLIPQTTAALPRFTVGSHKKLELSEEGDMFIAIGVDKLCLCPPLIIPQPNDYRSQSIRTNVHPPQLLLKNQY
eukprot:scaffold5795_cov165-Amphora_coffeaeformis.AAC.3